VVRARSEHDKFTRRLEKRGVEISSTTAHRLLKISEARVFVIDKTVTISPSSTGEGFLPTSWKWTRRLAAC
jgi:arginine deiminase